MSRSTAALLIAIMFHILLMLLFGFFMNLKPEVTKTKPQEHRIKVALKEQPKSSKKSAAVKNKVKPVEKVPPMPKGKQLKKIVKPPKQVKVPKVEPKKPNKAEPKRVEPKKIVKKPVKKKPVQTITSKKKEPAFKHVEKFAKTEDVNITKKPVKEKSAMERFLSTKKKTKEQKTNKKRQGTQVGRDFQEAYGETFGKLSKGEQKYIIDNQEIMRRITQEQLNRLAPVNIPRNLSAHTMNIIEFYLYPNGDISDLKLISNSSFEILDDTSIQTIEYSYHRYPLPKQKTLIRYKVGYYLGGRQR